MVHRRRSHKYLMVVALAEDEARCRRILRQPAGATGIVSLICSIKFDGDFASHVGYPDRLDALSVEKSHS